uniref:Uncharacterized protein n=1 Tax=Chromera velia CCMP2878 TaxID=1169474 RepID=A0A0G4I7G9_9ALVE|eukprot:Cvel_11665.t1-p1 / transcript=Cvel_11665.t1 / gene=Cvel_11665 / organism=Chromera_velia_CCMP2878 / gene_product=hypothetical protein / transcript_product=hypothetical protein / location=Cvel_scaffold739:39896-41384(+) / protein_length=264 / sequence_SO=supercontig / SO=protein_coding / is_pseudo=false
MQIAVQPAQSRQFTAFSVLHLLYASFPENQPDSSVSEEDYLALPGCDGLHENHRTRKEGWTPLMLAAHVGNQDAGVALLEMQGTSVQTKWTPEGWNGPATHDAQIDPEAHRDVNQVSALFHAAASGSTWLAAQIMWHLIKKSPGDAKKIFKRAEIKFTTDGESDLIKELSVVDFALYHKKTSTTAVIIQKMKELAAREDSGISIEHYIPAEGRENTDAVDELLDQKAELHGELVENAVTHWGEIQRGSTLQEAINEFLSKRGVV